MTADGSILASELLGLAKRIAVEVGDHLVASLTGPGPMVTAKSTATDLVTDLDRWAEARITERIREARPDDTIIGEEGASVAGTSGISWCIDPIDGTVNFVHGLAGFCVSIAAGDERGPLLGVVHSPLHRELFSAVRGGGARLDGEPIRCSTPPSLARSVIGTGFGYAPDRRRRQAEVLTRVIGEIADIRRIGAAALDLCLVACGRLDGYWEIGLNPWDHAAGALIAAEAGAIVRIDEVPGRPSYVVAAAPTIWDDFDRLLGEAGAAAV